MEQLCFVENKPIHIGMFIYKEKIPNTYNETKVYLLNDKHKEVYFIMKYRLEFDGEFFLFQYKGEEYSEEVQCIDPIDLFKYIKYDNYNTARLHFNYYEDIDRAIVRTYLDDNLFHYHIGYKLLVKPEEEHEYFMLDGAFSKEEGILLNYIYKDKKADYDYREYPDEIEGHDTIYNKYVLPKLMAWDRYKRERLFTSPS